ncbi:elongator complex protein 5-like [Ceratina calcarata]|uniref:Elongator complex protein 5 n=1 Tax=Ceratina calcarata TaxID=156304 RepID=A0AAJ7IVP9_9HYME|nr:elongator complex protein 5-like [Ceratina calcarata]
MCKIDVEFVLDEEVDAVYARDLIAGWLEMWREREPEQTFDILLFSDPKYMFDGPGPFATSNIKIHDYYTIDINEPDVNSTREQDFHNLEHVLQNINIKSIVIVDCLSSLILSIGLSKTLWFLKRLSEQVPQLICIYRNDFIQDKISCIDTLGTTYVKIQRFLGTKTDNNNMNYVVDFVHRKVGGGILRQQEIVNQNYTSNKIQSEKIEKNEKSDMGYKNQKQKIESSFKIEINENEMKQRNELVLPYMINATSTSKIHYQPESIDDFDEEDPDDDLCI